MTHTTTGGLAWFRRERKTRIEAIARVALRMGEHLAAIALKAVSALGAKIVPTVDGEWRWTRLFRSHEQADGRRGSGHASDVGRERLGVMAAEREGIDPIMAGQR